jgi:hypothetical protein
MSSAKELDALDAARGGPFSYRSGGHVYTTVDPADLSFDAVLMILSIGTLLAVPNMPLWKRYALTQRWAAHYDIPTIDQANRLAYVVNRYRADLEYDLRVHANVDLGEAWRSRRWRTLLATIDRLPSHSYYSEAVSQDPEHARMLAEAMAAAPESDEPASAAPPLRTWTPEVRLLTDILDAVRRVEWATIAVGSPSGKAPKPPQPAPRPKSLLSSATKRAEHDKRLAAHKTLVQRLLPHKRDS